MLAPAAAWAQVVVSEVHWAGSPVSTADEWFEIVNRGDEIIDLTGWTVTSRKSDGSDEIMITFEDILLPPEEALLIANYSAEDSALAVHPHIVTTEISLPNTKLLLRILNAAEEVIDEVDDFSGAPFAGSNAPHASMERIDLSAAGTLK